MSHQAFCDFLPRNVRITSGVRPKIFQNLFGFSSGFVTYIQGSCRHWSARWNEATWGGAHLWLCCVTCLFWSFAPHLRKSCQLQIFCTVSSYLLFIITHPAFFTHSWGHKVNHTMFGSLDNLSKPINLNYYCWWETDQCWFQSRTLAVYSRMWSLPFWI